jgi:hypothetical protein
MVERLHRQIKDSLRARNCGAAWAEHLPWVMLGLRATPKEDSDVSAAEMVYQSQLVLPNQVLLKLHGADDFVQPKEIQLRPRSDADEVKGPAQQLEEVEFVYVRRGPVSGPLTPTYEGPYRVVSRCGKVYRIQMGARVEAVSVDRLKPHAGSSVPQAAEPPRRGRPSGTGG